MLPLGKVDGDWSDTPVYLIGGGTSLDGFDFDKIRGLGVMVGANKAAWLAGCDVLVTLDQNFVRHHRDDIQHFVNEGGEAVLVMPVNEAGHKIIDGALYLVRDRHDGLSTDPRYIYGVNSGYAALGLAYLRKAKNIALLGYDMGYGNSGKTHFHDGYLWHNKHSHRFMSQWARAFERANQQLTEAGTKVINFCGDPESKIQWFEKRPLDDIA